MSKTSYIDHHAHVWGTGYKVTHPKLDDAASIDEIHAILKPLLETANGGWVSARGWDQNKWGKKVFPTKEDLDVLSADIPIALTRIDGHAMWCNSKALELACITSSTAIPHGGDILKTASGSLSGILLDDAMQLIHSAIPPESFEQTKQMLCSGLLEFAKQHIGVHDMGIPAEWWEPYKQLYVESGNELPTSWVFLDMSKPSGRNLFLQKIEEKTFDDSPHNNLKLVGIKLYLDGALGSRGAQLFEPYSDAPETRGLALTQNSDALFLMEAAAKRGLQIAIHAIGDAANARALDLIQAVKPLASSDAIFRIEHAQIVCEEDLERYHNLNVTAVIQPQFFASDRHWAIDRLGTERMKTAYRWKSLLNAGIVIAGSSDSPIEAAEALTGIELFQTRDGVNDGEQLSKEEAERAYSICHLDR